MIAVHTPSAKHTALSDTPLLLWTRGYWLKFTQHPESCCRLALRVLQFLPCSFKPQSYTRDGSGSCGSCLDHSGIASQSRLLGSISRFIWGDSGSLLTDSTCARSSHRGGNGGGKTEYSQSKSHVRRRLGSSSERTWERRTRKTCLRAGIMVV